jgi:hypothetical protein
MWEIDPNHPCDLGDPSTQMVIAFFASISLGILIACLAL